ncbi:hypothetical protein [Streptomyces sp. NPDC095602]|uniref:hypothetical protein n=1 Tax=unclassified Streptomyces TaxID=2593676 RepID=UPI00332D1C5C
MHQPRFRPTTTPTVTFHAGDMVLYRDADRFWAGEPGHTFVCRVVRTEPDGTYELSNVKTLHRIVGARADYMRLLPPADTMRDIDTAPLNTDGTAADMTSAATAWLAQQSARPCQPPVQGELPPQRG